ncbi:MAG: D-alanyl-D-alanine carboxypeptidase family protein [Verrucomicrobiae bacterium]
MKISHLLLAILFVAAPVFAADPPPVFAKSAILFDANSGKVLFKKNADEQRPVASTQKLLTALIVADSGDLSNIVTIKEADENVEPTKLNTRPGQQYSRSQLLHALLIKSCNDIARALARDNAGSIPEFAERMNATMRRLGGNDSNFVNPNGLPADGQFSTARDMARVARAVYRDPTLREIINKRYYDFRFSTGKTVTLKNTNRVLRHYSFCNGMKTGYTEKAHHCLISSGSYNGRDVIAVVLDSTKSRIWDESLMLLAYGLGIPPGSVDKFRIVGAE